MGFNAPSNTLDKKADTLPEGYDKLLFEAYLWSNLRFPQGGWGLVVSTADFLLSKGRFDPVAFAKRNLTEEEVSRVGAAMNKAHAAHGVAHATQEGVAKVEGAIGRPVSIVKDERLQYVWEAVRFSSLTFMATLMGISEGDPGWPLPNLPSVKEGLAAVDEDELQECVGRFARKARELKGFEKIRPIAHSFNETLRSEAGKAYGLAIRQLAREQATSTDQKISESKSEEMVKRFTELLALCFTNYKNQHRLNNAQLAELNKAETALLEEF